MGLVKVGMQTGQIEGEAGKHNKFQFFTKTCLGGWQMLSHCDFLIKETILSGLQISARNHERIIISLFSKVAGKPK